jgi:hypothetical protein
MAQKRIQPFSRPDFPLLIQMVTEDIQALRESLVELEIGCTHSVLIDRSVGELTKTNSQTKVVLDAPAAFSQLVRALGGDEATNHALGSAVLCCSVCGVADSDATRIAVVAGKAFCLPCAERAETF